MGVSPMRTAAFRSTFCVIYQRRFAIVHGRDAHAT